MYQSSRSGVSWNQYAMSFIFTGEIENPIICLGKIISRPFLHSDPRLPRAVNGDHAFLVHQFLLVKSLNVVSSLLSNGWGESGQRWWLGQCSGSMVPAFQFPSCCSLDCCSEKQTEKTAAVSHIPRMRHFTHRTRTNYFEKTSLNIKTALILGLWPISSTHIS